MENKKKMIISLVVFMTFCWVSACSDSKDKVYKAKSNYWKATLRVSDQDQRNIKLRVEPVGVIDPNMQSFKYELISEHGHLSGSEEIDQSDKFVYEKGFITSYDFLPNESGEFQLKLKVSGKIEELILK